MNPESLHDFLKWQAPPIVELIGSGLLPRGSVLILYGEQETFKTWLTIQLGFSLIYGSQWMIWQTRQARVLMYNPELPKAQYQRRIKQYMLKHHLNGSTPNMLYLETNLDMKLDTAMGYNELEDGIAKSGADVVVIDGLYRVVTGDLSHGPDSIRFQDNIDRLKSKYNTAFVIIHHARQASYDSNIGSAVRLGASEMFGSSFWKDWADTIITVQKEDSDEDIVRLVAQKARHAEIPVLSAPFWFDRNKLKFWLV